LTPLRAEGQEDGISGSNFGGNRSSAAGLVELRPATAGLAGEGSCKMEKFDLANCTSNGCEVNGTDLNGKPCTKSGSYKVVHPGKRVEAVDDDSEHAIGGESTTWNQCKEQTCRALLPPNTFCTRIKDWDLCIESNCMSFKKCKSGGRCVWARGLRGREKASMCDDSCVDYEQRSASDFQCVSLEGLIDDVPKGEPLKVKDINVLPADEATCKKDTADCHKNGCLTIARNPEAYNFMKQQNEEIECQVSRKFFVHGVNNGYHLEVQEDINWDPQDCTKDIRCQAFLPPDEFCDGIKDIDLCYEANCMAVAAKCGDNRDNVCVKVRDLRGKKGADTCGDSCKWTGLWEKRSKLNCVSLAFGLLDALKDDSLESLLTDGKVTPPS